MLRIDAQIVTQVTAILAWRTSIALRLLTALLSLGSAMVVSGATCTPPTVTLNPTNQIVCAGATVMLSSVAIGSPAPDVRWQVSTNGGMTWTNLWPIAAATSTNYTFTATAADNGRYYRAKFTNICGIVTNVPVLLSVGTTATPLTSQDVCPGSDVTFSTIASGLGPFTFKWRKSGSTNVLSTNSSLAFTNVTVGNAGTYSVAVSGGCNSVTNTATLAVSSTVSGTALTNLNRFVGGIAIFNGAGKTGGPFTYQWRKDGTPLPGQTNSTLFLTDLTTGDSATYSIVISSSCGSATNSASLTVAPCFAQFDVMVVLDRTGTMSGQPYADARAAATNFAHNLRLSGATNDQIGLVSYNPTPTLNQTLTNSSLVFEQSVNSLGPATNGTCIGCAIQTAQNELISARHRPSSLPVLVLLSDGLPHDFDTPSNALFYANQAKSAGTRVFTVGFGEVDPVLMGMMASSTNDFLYATNSSGLTTLFDAIATAICRPPTNIFGPDPFSATVCVGENVTFTMTASGCAYFNFQWIKDGTPLAGQTNSVIYLTNVTASSAGIYSVVVSSPCRTVTNSASLTVNVPPALISPPQNQIKCAGATATFNVSASGTALNYQWFKGNFAMANQTNSTLVISNVTPSDADNYYVIVSGICGNPLVYLATLAVNTPPTLTPLENVTACAGGAAVFNTVASGNGPYSFAWRKNGLLLPGKTNSFLVLTALSTPDAGTYSVEANGVCGSTTNTATLTVLRNTSATALSSLTRCVSESANFSTVPDGDGPFTFVWRRNGTAIPSATGPAFAVSSVTTNDAGVYSVEVTGACNSVTNTATLTVNQLTTALPLVDKIACLGEFVSFSTTAQGTGPFTFVWRKDGAVIPVATNSTLTIALVTNGSAGVYSVEISGVCNSITNSALLVVRELTSASPLSDATRCVGESVTFSTAAAGAGPFNFLWRKNGTLLPGATNRTLNIAAVTTNDAGIYSVEISGGCNTVTNTARLTVNELTGATPLGDATACIGTSASFSTVPNGTEPFTFVWRKDGVLLDGETNAALAIASVASDSAGVYTVEVSGKCDTIVRSAVLTARELTSATALADATRCVGGNVSFTTTPSGAGPFTFAWRKDGVLLASATNSAFSIASVTTNDAGAYTVEISGACNSVTNGATLTVRQLTTATALSSATRCLGEGVAFSTVASGAGPFTYTWRKDGILLASATNSTFSITSLTTNDAGTYTVEVSGICDSVTNTATLVVRPLTTATPLSGTARCIGSSVSFSTIAAGAGPFTYAWRKDGVLIASATNSTFSIASIGTNDAGIYSVEIGGGCNVITNSAALGVYELTTATALSNATRCTGESVTFGTAAGGTGPFNFVWRKNGVVLPGQTNSSLILNSLSAGDAAIYTVEVTGACGAATNTVTLSVLRPLTATPLTDITRCVGEAASLSTVPDGDGSFTYVWRKDGVLIASANTSTFSFRSVGTNTAGLYTVEVTGSCNRVTNAMRLTVNERTAVAPLADVSVCPGATALFSSAVTGTGPFRYEWRKDGALLSGETNGTLFVAATNGSAGVYSVEVIGLCNNATASGRLTVLTNTSASPFPNQNVFFGNAVTFSASAEGTGPFTYVWRKDGAAIPGGTNASITMTNVAVSDAGIYSVEVRGACGAVTNSAMLQVAGAIVGALTDSSVCIGQIATFNATVTSSVNCTYAWRHNGVLLPGETNTTLRVTSVDFSKTGIYSFEVSGVFGTIATNATLNLNTNVSVATLSDQVQCEGRSTIFTAVVSGTGPFTYRWSKDGVTIADATNATLTIPSVTYTDAGWYAVEVEGPCNTASASGVLIVGATPLKGATICSGEYANFSTLASGGGHPISYIWRKNGVIIFGQTNSSITISNASVADSGLYSVEIVGCGNITNTAMLNVRAPLTASMPASLSACSCSDLTLTPVVSGTGPFTYVWKKDGVVLVDQTNLTLNLSRLNMESPGVFTLEISGPCNSVTNSTRLDLLAPSGSHLTNSTQIVIPEFGNASPYPSRLFVQCTPGPITELRVTLNGLSHTFPDDLDILLVGPDNTSVKLLSDCGGGSANFLMDVDLTFDDRVTNALPDSLQIASGTYKPTDYSGGDADSFSAPAPVGATVGPLSRFVGKEPNGYWSLYIVDDHGRDAGTLKSWSLDFGRNIFLLDNVWLDQLQKLPDGAFQMRVNGEPNKTYYLEASTDLKQWHIIQTNVLTSVTGTVIDTTAPYFNYRFYRASGCRD